MMDWVAFIGWMSIVAGIVAGCAGQPWLTLVLAGSTLQLIAWLNELTYPEDM